MLTFLNQLFGAFTPSYPGIPMHREIVDRFWWGGEYLSIANGLHALLMGTTQSGKTTIQRIVQQFLLPQVRTRPNTRGIVYDPKDDMCAILAATQFGLLDYIIPVNPSLASSRAWLMYRDIKTDDRAHKCAETMTPKESSKNDQESFFSTTVRNLTRAAMSGLIRRDVPWHLRDLLLAMTNENALQELLLPYFDTAITYNLALNEREETARDVRASINSLFNRFCCVAAQWHQAAKERAGFSITDWESSNSILILPGASGDGDPLQVLTQVLVDQIAVRILAGPEARDVPNNPPRILVFIDELRQAGYLRRLKDLLFKSASKGARCFLGAQGVEGLRAVFGDHEASELMNLCGLKAFLRVYGEESARWMSNQINSQLVKETDIGVTIGNGRESRTSTTRRVRRELVEPIRFLKMRTPDCDGEMEVCFMAPELRAQGRDVFWKRIPAHKFYSEGGLVWPKGSLSHLTLRHEKHQILEPWDANDLARLKLPSHVLRNQSHELRFTSISYKHFES